MTRRLLALTVLVALLLAGPVFAQTADETTLADLEHWKKVLAESNVAIRHLDFKIAEDGHATRAKLKKGDLVAAGDEDFARLRAKNERKVDALIAKTERAIKAQAIQPKLDELPGATDPLLKDWFRGVVTSTEGKKLDLADAIHYYLKRRITTKIALDIAEGPIRFRFYDQGDSPPRDTKPGDVWLELGQPFPLLAAKAIEEGSLALAKGRPSPAAEANALLRALHFLAVKKIPDGLSMNEDPLFTKGAELRSNPDALVALVEERMGGLSKKERAKLEDKAFHHYTKHLPDEVLATAPTEGLAAKIVSSMTGNETALEKIKRLVDARDALFEKYGTAPAVPTSDLRAIIDEAVRGAASPEERAVER